jgi:hypothetical protein
MSSRLWFLLEGLGRIHSLKAACLSSCFLEAWEVREAAFKSLQVGSLQNSKSTNNDLSHTVLHIQPLTLGRTLSFSRTWPSFTRPMKDNLPYLKSTGPGNITQLWVCCPITATIHALTQGEGITQDMNIRRRETARLSWPIIATSGFLFWCGKCH